jgi:hypothetical protein
MDPKKDRVVHVLAPDLDPLVNAADSHGLEAVDAIG